jgi:hypothetical protein
VTRPVLIDPRALRAFGFRPGEIVAARPGTVLVTADGTALRVTDAGALDPVVQGGTPWGRSLAADPAARRLP